MSIGVGKYVVLAAAGSGGEPYWTALYDGSGDDEFNDVTTDTDNNIYLVGKTPTGIGTNNSLLFKFANDGTAEFAYTLGINVSTQQTHGEGIALDSSGNIYVTGYTVAVGDGEEGFIAKYNSSGTLQWDKRLGSSSSADRFFRCAVDSSNDIVVVGRYEQSSTSYQDEILVAKYNSSGTLQWDRRIDGSGDDSAIGIDVDSSNNIYISGQTSSSGVQGSNDMFIAKYNSSGTIQWKRTLGSTSNDIGKGIAVDSSGNAYMIGYSNESGAYDSVLAKYNSSGTFQWDKRLGGTGSEFSWGVAIDSSDNIIISGYSNSPGTSGSYDGLIAKYNSSGTLVFQKLLGLSLSGSNPSDRLVGCAVNANDDIIVCGYSTVTTNGDSAWVAKVAGDGSGTGTFTGGSYTVTYQDASLTASDISLTDAAASASDAAVSLTENNAQLTSQLPGLTLTKIDM